MEKPSEKKGKKSLQHPKQHKISCWGIQCGRKNDWKREVSGVRNRIEARACELANYMIETGATVRAAAKKFGISKSTVHKDVTKRNVLAG